MPKFFQNTRYLEHVNINKYLSYTGVNRPGDGPCPLAAYLVTGTGSTSFFGEKYTSGVGDGSLRTRAVLWLPAKRDYGPDLNQKQVPVCTMRWRPQRPIYRSEISGL